MADKTCPRGHLMSSGRCSVCSHDDPLPAAAPGPSVIQIRWSDRDFTFESAAEALAAGFHL